MLQKASDGFSGSFHTDSQQQQMDNGDPNGTGTHRCFDWRSDWYTDWCPDSYRLKCKVPSETQTTRDSPVDESTSRLSYRQVT